VLAGRRSSSGAADRQKLKEKSMKRSTLLALALAASLSPTLARSQVA
jgi:hypothetical protein